MLSFLRRAIPTTTAACVSLSIAFSTAASTTMATSNQLSTVPPIVAYCTDVEGSWQYWESYIAISRVLERNKLTGALELANDAHFVFGGDAVDQGNGDLRFLQDLLTLQDSYPSRVHFVLGNRDFNKMRLIDELSSEHMTKYPWSNNNNKYPGVYWRPNAKQDKDNNNNNDNYDTAQDTRAFRLKWILSQTMGSGRTFELRRQELAMQSNVDITLIEDDTVVQSFVDSTGPDSTLGLLRKYLELGNLGVVIGDTMFIHGGLAPTVMGWLPSCESGTTEQNDTDNVGVYEKDAKKWIQRLNIFCKNEIKNWSLAHRNGQDPARKDGEIWAFKGGYTGDQFAGGNIMQYGMGWMPNGSRNPTIVYRDWMAPPIPTPIPTPSTTSNEAKSKGGRVSSTGKLEAPSPSWRPPSTVVSPRKPHADVVKYLKDGGIKKVVCGHKPHGDAALIIKTEDITVITVDTSYSASTEVLNGTDDEKPCGTDIDPRRGVAVSELIISFCEKKNEDEGEEKERMSVESFAEIHGVLANGDLYACFPDGKDIMLAGKILEDGGWVIKGRRIKDGKIILSRLKGWTPENKFVDLLELELELEDNNKLNQSGVFSKL